MWYLDGVGQGCPKEETVEKQKTFEQLVAESEDLVFGDMLLESPEGLGLEGVVHTWIILTKLEEQIKARKERLRKWLMGRIEEAGSPTSHGGQDIRGPLGWLVREKRVATAPDEEGVRALLESKEIPLDKGFSKVTKVVMDPSKLETLVDLGTIRKDEIDALRKVVWALKVKPSEELVEALDRAIGIGREQPEGV
jgi:hypothetical protein